MHALLLPCTPFKAALLKPKPRLISAAVKREFAHRKRPGRDIPTHVRPAALPGRPGPVPWAQVGRGGDLGGTEALGDRPAMAPCCRRQRRQLRRRPVVPACRGGQLVCGNLPGACGGTQGCSNVCVAMAYTRTTDGPPVLCLMCRHRCRRPLHALRCPRVQVRHGGSEQDRRQRRGGSNGLPSSIAHFSSSSGAGSRGGSGAGAAAGDKPTPAPPAAAAAVDTSSGSGGGGSMEERGERMGDIEVLRELSR